MAGARGDGADLAGEFVYVKVDADGACRVVADDGDLAPGLMAGRQDIGQVRGGCCRMGGSGLQRCQFGFDLAGQRRTSDGGEVEDLEPVAGVPDRRGQANACARENRSQPRGNRCRRRAREQRAHRAVEVDQQVARPQEDAVKGVNRHTRGSQRLTPAMISR